MVGQYYKRLAHWEWDESEYKCVMEPCPANAEAPGRPTFFRVAAVLSAPVQSTSV